MYRFRLLLGILLLSLSVACASSPRPAETTRANSRIDRPLNRGAAFYLQGCYARSLEYFLEAHERYTAIDSLAGIASSLNSIANVYYQLDEIPSALGAYAEALAAYRQMEDQEGAVRVLANQSAALVRSGRLDEADRALDQADALDDGKQRLRSLRLKNRALVAMARKESAVAESLLTEALAGSRPEDLSTKAATYYALGRLLADRERPREAEPHLQAALSIDRELGAYPSVAKDLAALGSCYAQLGDHAKAVSFFLRSAKIWALLQNTARTQEVITLLKDSAERSGTDVQASLYWVAEWLEGRTEGNLCR